MGLFGDSLKEKELKALMTKAAETMKNLINEVEEHQFVTSLAKYYINQLAAEVNSLFEESADLSTRQNISIKTIIAGQNISIVDAKIAFVRFMNDFTRQTGERFPLHNNN